MSLEKRASNFSSSATMSFCQDCMEYQEHRVHRLSRGEAVSYAYSFIGRRPCLWCHATKDEIQLPLESRGKCHSRSLATLRQDFVRFTASGSDLKKAKLFNNVIAPFLFEIDIDHVRKSCQRYKLRC